MEKEREHTKLQFKQKASETFPEPRKNKNRTRNRIRNTLASPSAWAVYVCAGVGKLVEWARGGELSFALLIVISKQAYVRVIGFCWSRGDRLFHPNAQI